VKPCEQFDEALHLDYVFGLLDDAQTGRVKAHLKTCPACASEVALFRRALRMADVARDITIPEGILDRLEMQVYKRLAADQKSDEPSALNKFFGAFKRRRLGWVWRGAVATCVLAAGIPITTRLIERKEASPPVVIEVVVPAPHERIEQLEQEEKQLRTEEAIYARHLRGDERVAALLLAERPR